MLRIHQILQVDLSAGKTAALDTAAYAKDYIGGRGICQKLYWDLMDPGVKPYDPESCLIFVTGLLAGTGAPSASRTFLAFKSPATYPHEELFSTSMAGGFGPMLKRAGYDGLIITGKAPAPSYLLVQNGKAELRSAESMIWGLDTYAVKDELWRRHGRDAEVMSIGVAGENMVREAIIQSDSNSSFAQGGPGAVMGSKLLKAVVVKGSAAVYVADPQTLLKTISECTGIVAKKLCEEGLINPFRSLWQGFPSELALEAQKGTALVKPAACDACALACKTAFHYTDGAGAGVMKCSIGGGLYSKGAFGAPAGDDSMPDEEAGGPPFMKIDRTVCDAMMLWEKYGINGHFLEMYSQGLDGILYRLIDAGIVTEENSGLPVDKIGEIEFARALMRKVALRESAFGDEMAEGAARFCAFIYPKLITNYTDDYVGGLYWARFINAVLGTIYTEEELAETYALRMINLARLIELREGRTKANDKLPDVFFTDGGGHYDRVVFEKKIVEYYELLGWDAETGLPRKSTLSKLGLADAGDELERKHGVALPK
jgi:aldehyde:ferredoxin oxidoreductase